MIKFKENILALIKKSLRFNFIKKILDKILFLRIQNDIESFGCFKDLDLIKLGSDHGGWTIPKDLLTASSTC